MNIIDQFGIDVFFGSQSAFLDHLALIFTNAFTWVPLYIALLILIIKNNDNMQQICVCFCMAILGIAMCSIMANVVAKPLVERIRPCNELEVKYLAQIAGNLHSKDFSFFSSHSANTMSLAVFFTLLVRNSTLSITLIAWSLLNAWTRLYLGQHYLTDVLVGLTWGIIVGIVCYMVCRFFYKKISTKLHFVSSQYTATGYSLIDIDIVLSVIALTVCIGIILQ